MQISAIPPHERTNDRTCNSGQIVGLLKSVQKEDIGTVNFDEFLTIVAPKVSSRDPRAEIMKVWTRLQSSDLSKTSTPRSQTWTDFWFIRSRFHWHHQLPRFKARRNRTRREIIGWRNEGTIAYSLLWLRLDVMILTTSNHRKWWRKPTATTMVSLIKKNFFVSCADVVTTHSTISTVIRISEIPLWYFNHVILTKSLICVMWWSCTPTVGAVVP